MAIVIRNNATAGEDAFRLEIFAAGQWTETKSVPAAAILEIAAAAADVSGGRTSFELVTLNGDDPILFLVDQTSRISGWGNLDQSLKARRCDLDVDQINLSLEEFYAKRIEEWRLLARESKRDGHSLSIPCFLKAQVEYVESPLKIMFVGQETHGWLTPLNQKIDSLRVQEVMDEYPLERDNLYAAYNSPYWTAIRQIVVRIGLANAPRSFLTSNVFPCDLDRHQAPIGLHSTFREWGVLKQEVAILRPDWIIFFCGPHYCGNLETYFGEGVLTPLTPENSLIRYEPRGQSWKGLVTYHPNALRWQKKGGEVIPRLANSILTSGTHPSKASVNSIGSR